MSESRPPSCFLLNRVFFGRGLRGHYIKAATDALSGTLRMCNIKAKLNRWKASIASAVEEDTRAGLWPGSQDSDGGYGYTEHFNYIRDTVIPAQIRRYRDSVACGKGGSRYACACGSCMHMHVHAHAHAHMHMRMHMRMHMHAYVALQVHSRAVGGVVRRSCRRDEESRRLHDWPLA